MNDKELLELAAKAAGIDVVWRNNSGAFYYDNPDTGREEFDPLTDDGDALRLAVKLGLNVSVNHPLDGAMVWTHLASAEEQLGSDQYAATRRAIVLAAAEIGRMM